MSPAASVPTGRAKRNASNPRNGLEQPGTDDRPAQRRLSITSRAHYADLNAFRYALGRHRRAGDIRRTPALPSSPGAGSANSRPTTPEPGSTSTARSHRRRTAGVYAARPDRQGGCRKATSRDGPSHAGDEHDPRTCSACRAVSGPIKKSSDDPSGRAGRGRGGCRPARNTHRLKVRLHRTHQAACWQRTNKYFRWPGAPGPSSSPKGAPVHERHSGPPARGRPRLTMTGLPWTRSSPPTGPPRQSVSQRPPKSPLSPPAGQPSLPAATAFFVAEPAAAYTVDKHATGRSPSRSRAPA